MLRSTGAAIGAALLLGGCWTPFPHCDGPRPSCYQSCATPLEADGCYGEAYDAVCFDEDGDVYWSCHQRERGRSADSCPEFVDACRIAEPGDGGTIPELDGGT